MVRLKDPTQTARWLTRSVTRHGWRSWKRRGEGEQRGRDLASALKLGPSLMSFHSRALKDATRLRDRREARWVYWSLDPANGETVKEWIAAPAGAAEVV
jgi:DNA-binding transcriptional ArsR family regulator